MSLSTPRPFRLLLMRHGQTHGNVAGALDTGFPGLDLTDLGRAQAEAAVDRLAPHAVENVFVSKLVRTHQTAAPLASHHAIAPVELPGIHEITAGEYEMATTREAVMGYLGTVQKWLTGELSARMPGAETGAEFLERYDADVATIAGSGAETALLVSHGAAIRTWVAARVPGVADLPEARQPLHNTGVITVESHPTTDWRLVDWHAEPIGGVTDGVGVMDPYRQSTSGA
ncbi:histidine phosphatase family protein [Nocardioides yefusunii]|uniref:Histidine phosphatase family protein n=1 Tax=Nocardioides yefusunii TaxID=2500546 RepID=A0ABW1QZK9_9ACTN|nr:histidine phosphatase family protein [Nocardioides yefusunii]